MRNLFIGALVSIAATCLAQTNQRTVADLLNLSGSQLVQLEQLYDYMHAVRYQEESRQKADTIVSEKRIRASFVASQREAKSMLSRGQMYLLEQRADQVREARDLRHRLLLVGTFEEFMASPVDVEAAKRWLDAQDAYSRDRYHDHRWFGYGFCGRPHWCDPTGARCKRNRPVAVTGSRRPTSPGITGARGGGTSIGGAKGGR